MTAVVAASAATMAAVWVGLYAGHQVGDHIVQTDAQAAGKGAPTVDELAAGANPWRGWSACLRHVAGYVATQALALALVAAVAPFTVSGAVAALAISGGTHAVIDRRWIVRWWLAATGRSGWVEGPYLTDQAAHQGVLLVAAVAGALCTTAVELVAVAAGVGAIVAAGVAGEWVRAAGHRHRVGAAELARRVRAAGQDAAFTVHRQGRLSGWERTWRLTDDCVHVAFHVLAIPPEEAGLWAWVKDGAGELREITRATPEYTSALRAAYEVAWDDDVVRDALEEWRQAILAGVPGPGDVRGAAAGRGVDRRHAAQVAKALWLVGRWHLARLTGRRAATVRAESDLAGYVDRLRSSQEPEEIQ